METDLTYLPPNLPVPTDDGACDHLDGLQIPDIQLAATDGTMLRLRNIPGRLVIYCYPMTGPSHIPLPP